VNRRTDGHGQIDSASDPGQEYIYLMGSETLPSACYIFPDESSIPFYSTSNGYKYTRYSAEGSKRETETYKQQSEIVKRHLPSISVQGNVGGRQSIGTDENVTGRRKRFRPHKAYIYSRVRLSVCEQTDRRTWPDRLG